MLIAPLQVALLLLTSAGTAQQQAPPTPANPPGFHTTVVVTGERRPEKLVDSVASVTVVTGVQLQQFPAVSLSEVLTAVPGYLMLLAQPGAGRPVLVTRGFFGGGEAEYVSGLVDDSAVGDADTGLIEWRLIPVSLLDRVEVVRGAASAAYGDTAFAGVVHAITRRTAPPQVELSADHRGSISGAGVGSVERASWTLLGAASASRASGFRRDADEDHGLWHLKAAHTGPNAVLRLSTNFSRLRRDEPGAIPPELLRTDARQVLPAFRGDHETTGRFTASAAYEATAPRGWTLYGRGHLARRGADRLRTVLLLPELPLRALQNADTTTLGITGQAVLTSAAWRPSESHIGMDVARDALTSAYGGDELTGAEPSSLSGSRQRLGIYSAHSAQLLSRLRVTAGVRFDRIRDNFAGGASDIAAWSPRIGVVAATGASARAPMVYAQVNRAFKAPTLNQRFDNRAFPDFQGGTFTISHAGLRAQRSVNLEAGIRQSLGQFSWNAAAYRMRVRDEIDFDLRTFRYGNIAASHHHGVEVDAQFTASPSAGGGVAYSWMRVYSTGDAAKRQLKNVPQHVLRVWARAAPTEGLAVTGVFTYANGAFLDEAAGVPVEASGGLDLRAERRWTRVAVAAELLNTLNQVRGAYGYTVLTLTGQEQPFVYPASGRTPRLRCSLMF